MHPEAEEELRVRLKLVILELAEDLGVTKTCREFNVPRSSFYRWKQKYQKAGESGLHRERPVAYHHPRQTVPEVVAKILEFRKEYQFGALRIKYYLERYHGIRISESTVSRVLKSHGVERLPKTLPGVLYTPNDMPKRSRTPHSGRCEVLAAERSRGKDRETVPIHSHR